MVGPDRGGAGRPSPAHAGRASSTPWSIWPAHLPSHVHLIVTTRQPGGLPLHRLRMSGDLVEIDQDELRFIGRRGRPACSQSVAIRRYRPSQVEVLTARTEGWAAGLRLAGTDPGRSKRMEPTSPAACSTVSSFARRRIFRTRGAGRPAPRHRPVHDGNVGAGGDERPELCQEVTDRADAGAHPGGPGRPPPVHAAHGRQGPQVSATTISSPSSCAVAWPCKTPRGPVKLVCRAASWMRAKRARPGRLSTIWSKATPMTKPWPWARGVTVGFAGAQPQSTDRR